MNILVTGAKGMVGTALVNNLKNIRDGKNRTRPLSIEEIYEYDLDSTPEELEEYCQKADFVFNLAGVNRPENPEDFQKGEDKYYFFLLSLQSERGIPDCQKHTLLSYPAGFFSSACPIRYYQYVPFCPAYTPP